MKSDYLSYQRGTSMSLLGLAIQLALGLAWLVYGIYGRDHAAISASAFMLLGVPVWLVLAVVFDQHRRERIEAIEAEAFAASDAASSSVFDRQADDLRVQERKLKFMHRWLVPAVSIAVGAALIAVGLWRFQSGRRLLEEFAAVPERGWPMGLGLGTAFVAFVFARYVAVMSRQRAWTHLRAGAGFAVGTAVMALAVAVGHLIDIAGPDTVLRWLVVVVPVALVLLGVEVFLNFVLDVYRPRKAGELPRPAVESRLLGFIAAPDQIAESIGEAINYQFGYDVAGSWVYKLLSRVLLRVLLPVAILVAWGMSSLAVIRPHQKGIVTRFGAFQRVIEPGLNFKLPWPIESVDIPEYVVKDAKGQETFRARTVTGVRTLNIGSIPQAEGTGPILWTNDHAAEEVYFLVQPIVSREASASFGLAQVAIEVPLHYAIEDLEAYERLAPPGMRDELIRSIAQRELMQFVSSRSISELLSDRRGEFSTEISRRIESALAAINPRQNGRPVVRLIFAGIGGLHPPKDAATAFEGVVVAQQKYAARLKAAEATAIETMARTVGSVSLAQRIIAELDARDRLSSAGPEGAADSEQVARERAAREQAARELLRQAGGRVASILAQAGADRWQQHIGERTRVEAYAGLLGAFKASPEVFRAGLYFDAMRDAMADARLFIVDHGVPLNIRFDGQDRDTIGNIFDTQQPK